MLLNSIIVCSKSHWLLVILGLHAAVALLHGEGAYGTSIDQNGIFENLRTVEKTIADLQLARDPYTEMDVAKASKLASVLANDARKLAQHLHKIHPLIHAVRRKQEEKTEAMVHRLSPSLLEKASSRSQHGFRNIQNLEPLGREPNHQRKTTLPPLSDDPINEPEYGAEEFTSERKHHWWLIVIYIAVILVMVFFIYLWCYHVKLMLRLGQFRNL